MLQVIGILFSFLVNDKIPFLVKSSCLRKGIPGRSSEEERGDMAASHGFCDGEGQCLSDIAINI